MSRKESRGNYVSEWFGHRVHPVVAATKRSLLDQRGSHCPFLSVATGTERLCVKSQASLGICTISSPSNGPRQDWLVCPYRALDPTLVNDVSARLFADRSGGNLIVIPGPQLASETRRKQLLRSLRTGNRAVVYFQANLGGEISLPATDSSPELAFDITLVELAAERGRPLLMRYGILELQTMDFHGSYRAVVKNLVDALRLHGDQFHSAVKTNQHWLSEKIEGPNIANVFKRTFYQIMLKFQVGADESCAGCVLALPASVWDSWQRHLGKPELEGGPDGEYLLRAPGDEVDRPVPAWIYVFDIVSSAKSTPNPLSITKVIGTDAPSLGYYALKVAPEAAVAGAGSADRVLNTLKRKIAQWWPEVELRARTKPRSR